MKILVTGANGFIGSNLCASLIQKGDPLALYPQAEINARAVRQSYELLQIEESKEKAG